MTDISACLDCAASDNCEYKHTGSCPCADCDDRPEWCDFCIVIKRGRGKEVTPNDAS